VEAPLVEFNIRLLEAEIARLTRSPEEFATVLAGALGLGRQHGYANGFHTGSQLLKKLLPHALQLGVEVSYCQWVIRKRNFKPPSAAISRWPWPVKIKAMGRLEVTVDGAPLSFGRKAQRKPLDLLKLLLTHADGVEITRLMDLMWPDSEADSARNALDLTLHRLRRMLKTTEAVLLTDGRILLSRDVVASPSSYVAPSYANKHSVEPGTHAAHSANLRQSYRITSSTAPVQNGVRGGTPVAATLLSCAAI
jgi:hypothetical protein